MAVLDMSLPVGQIAALHPKTRPVLERWGIDYCCGGKRLLSEAISDLHLDSGVVTGSLEKAASEPLEESPPWQGGTLTDLVNHIIGKHHQYMRQALPRIDSLLGKVLIAHGERHGRLLRDLRTVFDSLRSEIDLHLQKEEQVLFPYIIALSAYAGGKGQPPAIGCGSAAHPIGQMEHEHENAGTALDKMREITNEYALPEDACATFAALYDELNNMRRDLHEHIHLENNILFPQTLQAEEDAGVA